MNEKQMLDWIDVQGGALDAFLCSGRDERVIGICQRVVLLSGVGSKNINIHGNGMVTGIYARHIQEADGFSGLRLVKNPSI